MAQDGYFSSTQTIQSTPSTFTSGSVIFEGPSNFLAQNNSNLFWNNTSGYLGIGTNVPDSPLTISSSPIIPPQITGTQSSMHIVGPAGGGTLALYDSFANTDQQVMRRADGTSASPSAVQNNDIIGQYLFYGYGATSYQSSAGAKIVSTATENFTDSTGAMNLAFYTRPSGTITGSTERMRIDQNGKVGIGITTPSSLLQVNSTTSAAPSSIASLNGSNAGSGINVLSLVNTATPTVGNETDLDFHVSNIYGPTAQLGAILTNTISATTDLAFSTYNGTSLTEKMRLTASGNLGIGNTTAAQTLTVTGNASISSLNSAAPVRSNTSGLLSNGTIVLSAASDVSGTLPIANGGTNNSLNYTAGSVIFSNGTSLIQNNAQLFWDNTNNRLGIGTASPANPLQISGSLAGNISANVTNSLASNQNSAGYTVTNDAGNQSSLTIFSSSFVANYLQNTTRLGGTNSVWIASDINNASGGTDPISFSVGGYNNVTAQATTNGLTAINLTDTGIAASNAGAPLSITNGQVITAGISNNQISNSTAFNVSTTAATLNGTATITPAAGTYLVMFSGNVTASSAAGNTLSVELYVGGTAQADTVRQCTPTSSGAFSVFQYNSIGFQKIVSVNGSQAILVQGVTSAGTVTLNQFDFTLLRIA